MLVSNPRGFDRFLMTGGISNTSAWPDCCYTLFRTLGCSPSGPGALSGWILCSFFWTVSSVNVISATHSLVLWWNSGMVDLSSCTNTDLKKSPNTFAFSW